MEPVLSDVQRMILYSAAADGRPKNATQNENPFPVQTSLPFEIAKEPEDEDLDEDEDYDLDDIDDEDDWDDDDDWDDENDAVGVQVGLRAGLLFRLGDRYTPKQ